VPRRAVVLGACVVACEGAQILAGLGAAEVTVVGRGDRLLARTEPFAGELVADGLRPAASGSKLGASVALVRRPVAGGEVTVVLGDGREIVADEVLCALRRRPASADLGLASVGLEPGGQVPTDDHLTATGVPGAGCTRSATSPAGRLLTHMGKYQARVAGDVNRRAGARPAAGRPRFRGHLGPRRGSAGGLHRPAGGRRRVDRGRGPPRRARGGGGGFRPGQRVRGVDPARRLRRAGQAGGRHRQRDTARATFVGPDVAELVHAATVALVGRVPLETLWHAVPSFPTVSEVWLRLLEEWRSR